MGYHCHYCGSELRWNDDVMKSDFEVVCDEDEDCIVGLYECSKYHTDYRVYFPSPSEIEYDPDLACRIEIFNQADE